MSHYNKQSILICMKHLLLLIGFISIVFCQNPVKYLMPTKNFGTHGSIFFNAGTNQLDMEGSLEIQSYFGLYGDVWLAQLDMDQETDLVINSSVGWIKQVAPNSILGGGFSNSTNENLNELFFGGNIGIISLVGFYGLQNTPANFIAMLDLNFGPLKNTPIDISLMSFFEYSDSEHMLSLAKKYKNGIQLGYIFSREKFETEETRTFVNKGFTKTYKVPIQEDRFFHTVYIGFTY